MDVRKESKLCGLLEGNFDSSIENKFDLLSDELVVHILALLKLREAVKTSVLSKRWRNLWMRIPNFTFDSVQVFGRELNSAEQLLHTPEFVMHVDNVVSQLIALSPHPLSIRSLTVFYDLSLEGFPHIDRWVSFGIEHNVEHISLFFRREGTVAWAFPPQGLDEKRLGCVSELRLGGNGIVPNFVGFKNLKLVSLISVTVTDEAFANLLSNCLFLEDLFVLSAKNLMTIKIPEFLDRLRFLHVYYCAELLRLEVNAANVTVFSCLRNKADCSFNNMSKLTLLRLSRMDDIFWQLMKKNPLLHTLALDLGVLFDNFDRYFRALPTLTNLKVLMLSVVCSLEGFAVVVNFLRAASSLNQLYLHFTEPDFPIPETDKSATESFIHKHLQEIELRGFSGDEGHIDVVCSLLDSAVALKKMTIYPCYNRFYLQKGLRNRPHPECLDAIGKCTNKILSRLPPTAVLEFSE